LGDVYGATIHRIKAQEGDKSRLGMTALMWISHAERPLHADELCYALAVQLGSTDFDGGNIPSMSTLVNCCQGLITVDKEALTVRLIHFTLQEYLSGHLDLFIKPHSAMAEICLTYLNSKQVKALSTAHSPDTRNTPFLQYCSVYWGVHSKKELSEHGKSLALELLKEHYSQISSKLLLTQENMHLSDDDTYPLFSGLHCASFFGIVEVVVALIEVGGYDINGEGYRGCTPLSWAAYNGHEEVVKILLGRGEVIPDKGNKLGQTPLLEAARNGHQEVVKILLGCEEVSPDKPDESGRTPLFYAAEKGHEGVTKILLGREEVNPNKANIYCDTPLTEAAWNGHEGVVKLLLGREDISPDKAGQFGKTPLTWAARMGHVEVVKILLELGEANPNTPDMYGQTPLFNAILNGHEGVVKILLEREDVNPDKPHNCGMTPLSYATYKGNKRIVELLQSRKVIAPDTT